MIFCFAGVWGFGGPIASDKGPDYREDFSNWWRRNIDVCKFPATGSVFDYYVEIDMSEGDISDSISFQPWATQVPRYVLFTTNPKTIHMKK